jgi:hypothetical protein
MLERCVNLATTLHFFSLSWRLSSPYFVCHGCSGLSLLGCPHALWLACASRETSPKLRQHGLYTVVNILTGSEAHKEAVSMSNLPTLLLHHMRTSTTPEVRGPFQSWLGLQSQCIIVAVHPKFCCLNCGCRMLASFEQRTEQSTKILKKNLANNITLQDAWLDQCCQCLEKNKKQLCRH